MPACFVARTRCRGQQIGQRTMRDRLKIDIVYGVGDLHEAAGFVGELGETRRIGPQFHLLAPGREHVRGANRHHRRVPVLAREIDDASEVRQRDVVAAELERDITQPEQHAQPLRVRAAGKDERLGFVERAQGVAQLLACLVGEPALVDVSAGDERRLSGRLRGGENPRRLAPRIAGAAGAIERHAQPHSRFDLTALIRCCRQLVDRSRVPIERISSTKPCLHVCDLQRQPTRPRVPRQRRFQPCRSGFPSAARFSDSAHARRCGTSA